MNLGKQLKVLQQQQESICHWQQKLSLTKYIYFARSDDGNAVVMTMWFYMKNQPCYW